MFVKLGESKFVVVDATRDLAVGVDECGREHEYCVKKEEKRSSYLGEHGSIVKIFF